MDLKTLKENYVYMLIGFLISILFFKFILKWSNQSIIHVIVPIITLFIIIIISETWIFPFINKLLKYFAKSR